jgi:undecaprenyl diphosphate synthase
MKHLPRHIAIIMDGNGRWAEQQGLPRIRGHEEGAASVREITRECARLGVGHLTLYAFSSENWRRPDVEVEFLMALLHRYLVSERDEIMDNDVRFSCIGRLDALPPQVREEMATTTEMSHANGGLHLRLALNYGGRAEILDAVVRLAQDLSEGRIRETEVNEDRLREYLYDPGMPDPDLVIRTGGEYRLSNFLLWQASYAEIWTTPTLWPEFRKENLREALEVFTRRERRYGGIGPSEIS